jgi:hypothetical protein
MCFRDRIQRQDQENLSYLCYPILLKKKILKLTAFIKPDGIHHKSYAWVFGVICTFQSSQFFERLSMHFGVVDHIRAPALTTARGL